MLWLIFLTSPFNILGQDLDIETKKELLKQAADEKNYGKAGFYAYDLAKRQVVNNEFDEAHDLLSECLNYADKAEDNTLIYLAHQLKAATYKQEENYNRALNHFQKALKVAQEMQRTEFIKEGLMDVAESQILLGRDKRAVQPLEDALSIANRENDMLLRLQCYERLAAVHGRLSNEGKVKEYQALYNEIIQQQQEERQQRQEAAESEQEKEQLEQQLEEIGTLQENAKEQFSQQTRRLRRAEDSLLQTKYTLDEVTQSLEEAEQVKENQQLQIDLLNKGKELADSRLKEQEARLKNETLIRNTVLAIAFLISAIILVVILAYRRQVKANKKIHRQNENIQSSINYAKRIQEAMFHQSDLGKHGLSESFVLFKPRDVVSGDFYWVTEIKSWYDPDVVFAAVDCTGHGIPGAFMSMIGMNALNMIIGQGIAESNQILKALDNEIRTALQQEKTGNKDGMDAALCIYRKEKSLLEFSGAKNPLIYIQDNELVKIKGDAHAIGGSRINPNKEYEFKKHVIPIDQPTTIYLFSDGYQDQFGGEKNMKFMSKKFQQLLLEIHERPMGEQKEILDKTIEEWKGEYKQTDDILVMGIRLDSSDLDD